MNDTLRVVDRILCDACCEQVLAERDAPLTDLQRQVDPTVCATCRNDNGTAELPLLAGLPVCDPCTAFFRNRPFPPWIKVALAGVVALVVVSLVWNVRFYRAYGALRRFTACWEQGQAQAAAEHMALAAACVPECQDIGVMATYVEGVALLHQEKCSEALAKFLQCRDKLPPDSDVETFILYARSGAAFDAKDYDGFLAAAQAIDEKLPTHHMSKGGLASAWACKYAETGDTRFREQALSCLEEAGKLAQGDPAFAEYEGRIRYRLHSREIITRQEYQRRFPDGWREQKEE